jgi:putative copper export protein
MVGLGAANRRLLKIRQQREGHETGSISADHLFRNVWVESVLAFVVFGLAGALG